MAGEKLVKIMRQMNKESGKSSAMVGLVFGEVLSIAPLEIRIDSRFNITEEFIMLSNLCKEKSFQIEQLTVIDNSPNPHTHGTKITDVQMWRGIQVGDKLRMLRVGEGQLFYALERVGDL